MKNVTLMIGKHKLVVDLVFASLAQCSDAIEGKTIVTNIHGRVKYNLAGSEIRLADKKLGPRTTFSPR